MPSGITAAIYDGSDTTLRGYLMQIGRGMGFAVMQRDDDPREPVKPVEPQTGYYERELTRSRERLAELEAMTPRTARVAAREAADAARSAWADRRDHKLALRGRYEEMIRQVEAWEPEPLIATETQIKEEALKYLRESIEFDCGKPGEEMRYYPKPQTLTPDDWLKREIEATRAAIDRHEQSIREERTRTAERNRYITAFLASLPPAEEAVDA